MGAFSSSRKLSLSIMSRHVPSLHLPGRTKNLGTKRDRDKATKVT